MRLFVCVSVCWFVGLTVQGVICGKTAEWGQLRMVVLDGVIITEGEGAFWGKCGTSHCNQWGLCCFSQITLGFLVTLQLVLFLSVCSTISNTYSCMCSEDCDLHLVCSLY